VAILEESERKRRLDMSLRLLRVLAILAGAALPVFSGTIYLENNLVSDIPGVAAVTDPSLVNPWGLSHSGTSPWWVSDNGTGVATLYTGAGVKQGLTVTIPPPAGGAPPSAPTGQAFNSTPDFILGGGTKATFLFAAEDGTISGWNGGTNAILEVDNSASSAVYKGMTLGSVGTSNFLYAANFRAGKIDVFDGSFAPVSLPGGFVDPALPAGFAPFDIQNLGGLLYVTYAKQDAAKKDDVAGAGNGFVSVFNPNGSFVGRLISNGPLNSPWGLALAPVGFGDFSNDLLVGNFGDGKINAFNPTTGALVGTLSGMGGSPIVIEGLWGLGFGNGANAGAVNTLFFTAGIPGDDMIEDHGLFGDIVAAPEPATWWLAGLVLAAMSARRIFRT
jgi:uncharacterized protein (TIGR03118 family)